MTNYPKVSTIPYINHNNNIILILTIAFKNNFLNESKPNKSKHKNKVENNKKQSQSESKDENGFISKTKKKETFKQCSILNYVVSQKRETQEEKEIKKDENLENKKDIQKCKNKSKDRNNDNDRSKSKSKGGLYVKKIVSKSKSKIINSKLSKRNTIDNIRNNNTNAIKISNDEMSSKESVNNSNDKITIDNNKNNDDNKKDKGDDEDDGNNGKKADNNLSQIANKNFNETLFDYKKYNLMNNPRKRKQEFDYELKKTKKLKDISMKKKKKGWIKKSFIEKEQKEKGNEEKNDNKIILQNKKNKNKINMNNLNVINEEESNKKNEIKNNYYSDNKKEEEKEDENENDYSELNMFNKMFKRSQDDFGIDLLSTSHAMNERNNIINDSETDNIISKYSDVKLRSRNANIEKDINYQNWKNNNNDDENEIKLDEDINVNNKGRKKK